MSSYLKDNQLEAIHNVSTCEDLIKISNRLNESYNELLSDNNFIIDDLQTITTNIPSDIVSCSNFTVDIILNDIRPYILSMINMVGVLSSLGTLKTSIVNLLSEKNCLISGDIINVNIPSIDTEYIYSAIDSISKTTRYDTSQTTSKSTTTSWTTKWTAQWNVTEGPHYTPSETNAYMWVTSVEAQSGYYGGAYWNGTEILAYENMMEYPGITSVTSGGYTYYRGEYVTGGVSYTVAWSLYYIYRTYPSSRTTSQTTSRSTTTSYTTSWSINQTTSW